MESTDLNLVIVQALDAKRLDRNYKEGWLFHRCRERGLLEQLRSFRNGSRFDLEKLTIPTEFPLTIELVPETSWFTNVRSHVPPETWDRLRRDAYKQAQYKCQICGGRGEQHPVECHERWLYDETDNLQILCGLIALCPECHRVKHMGKANLDGFAHLAIAHLQKINGMSEDEASLYVERQFEQWKRRSEKEWFVDFTWLRQRGIEPESGEQEIVRSLAHPSKEEESLTIQDLIIIPAECTATEKETSTDLQSTKPRKLKLLLLIAAAALVGIVRLLLRWYR